MYYWYGVGLIGVAKEDSVSASSSNNRARSEGLWL